MGWLLNGVRFLFQDSATDVAAVGNSVAWFCPDCSALVLFEYHGGRAGSSAHTPASCHCGHRFYLHPQFDPSTEPPDDSRAPASSMKIVQLEGR